MRIVSIAPSNTELVCALGLGDYLVGVDDWSDYPPDAVRGLPRVGPDLDVDVDKIATLRPDLVICSLSVPGMEACVERVHQRGLPHVVLDPDSIPHMLDDIRQLGNVLGRQAEAVELVADLQRRMAAVQAATVGAPRHKLYWEWWPRPLIGPGGLNWLTMVSDLAGGVNVLSGTAARQARPTSDQIIAMDPDFIFLIWPGVTSEKLQRQVPRVALREDWSTITAVRKGQVYAPEEGRFCRPSPRLVDGLEEVARRIHPECFSA